MDRETLNIFIALLLSGLTLVIVAVGIQIYGLLGEMKKTTEVVRRRVEKIDTIIDTVEDFVLSRKLVKKVTKFAGKIRKRRNKNEQGK